MDKQTTKKKKKRSVPSRKGFPIRLQKSRWHLLLSALGYQIRAERKEGRQREDLRAIRTFFELHMADIPIAAYGVKTIRVRTGHVSVITDALRFASKLHSTFYGSNVCPSSLGHCFLTQAALLEKISAVELLADAGR